MSRARTQETHHGSAGHPQSTQRQSSSAIQQAADQFIALIESEKAKAREAVERRLATLETNFGQYQQHANAMITSAVARATTAEEQLRAAQQALAERDLQIANLNERLLELERRVAEEGAKANENQAVNLPAHEGKDQDSNAMMEFLNVDECDPMQELDITINADGMHGFLYPEWEDIGFDMSLEESEHGIENFAQDVPAVDMFEVLSDETMMGPDPQTNHSETPEPLILKVPEFPNKPRRFKPDVRALPRAELRRRFHFPLEWSD